MNSTALTRPLGALAVLLGVLCVGLPPATAAEEARPGEIVARLAAPAGLADVLQTFQLTLLQQLGPRPIFLLRAADAEATVAALRTDRRILYAEPNFVVFEPEGRRRAVWAIGEKDQYRQQWAPDAINLEEALTFSTGYGVKVAVIDSGVDMQHADLAPRLLPGFDFVDNDSDPSEQGSRADPVFGHGTHVAGLIALTAPGATIMPLRVLDANGEGSIWSVAEALLHAVDPDGDPRTPDHAQVVNLSVGTRSPTALLRNVSRIVACRLDDDDDDDNDNDNDNDHDGDDGDGSIDSERCAWQSGSIVIAAAGNDGSASASIFPAAEDSDILLSVTASTPEGALAEFANYGSWVDVAAPGEGITSTVPGGGYGTWSGTSMAAPIAAGIAALMVQSEPGLKPQEVIKRMVERSVPLCGAGPVRVDAAGAVFDRELPGPQCR